jgi:hypothetical protein
MRSPNILASAAGAVLMLFALTNSLVTLTDGNYRAVLLTAVASSLLSILCLLIPFVRGPLVYRVLATIIAMPAVFVWIDFARRFGRS